jgi:hypothetical protein
MTFLEPKKWTTWLSLAEWWYNTNYHTSLQCTPFQAFYGYPLPLISEVMIPGPESPAIEFLTHKQAMIRKLRENIAQAQARIKKYVDRNRFERQFQIGDMVYLKLQPFMQNAFGLHQSLKLTTKYYGPFRTLEKIVTAAYKLHLPPLADIYPTFHVSQLKQHIGPKDVPQTNLHMVTVEGYIKIEPETVLETRALPRHDEIITQWKVQWQNIPRKQHGKISSSSSHLFQSSIQSQLRNDGLQLILED